MVNHAASCAWATFFEAALERRSAATSRQYAAWASQSASVGSKGWNSDGMLLMVSPLPEIEHVDGQVRAAEMGGF
jgi:hypothetical protein